MNHDATRAHPLLARRLAEAGPGYRGQREPLSDAERETLLFDLGAAGLAPPAFFEARPGWVDRRAKLFETGEYADKGVTILPETLATLAANFDLPVPVLIEHSESPLELGYLTQVEAIGNELFGTLALTEEANALVERSQARSLSVGLSPDLSTIREVSLVRAPRVPDAQLFWSEIPGEPAMTSFADGSIDSEADELARLRSRVVELEAAHRQGRAEQTLDELLAQGRLTPAQMPFARALLAVNDTVEFDGESKPVAQLLIAMIERQPPVGLFREWAPERENPAGQSLLLPEEAAFYRTHFPDVSLDAIANAKHH